MYAYLETVLTNAVEFVTLAHMERVLRDALVCIIQNVLAGASMLVGRRPAECMKMSLLKR